MEEKKVERAPGAVQEQAPESVRQPLIAVMSIWEGDETSPWMVPYLESVRRAGGTPEIFPVTMDKEEIRELVGKYDGFLFSGGHDVTPALYNEESIGEMVVSLPERDEYECLVLEAVIAADKPVFAICRGSQFINAVLGGSLYQDLPMQHPSEIAHSQEPPYDRTVHEVQIVDGTPLSECLGGAESPEGSSNGMPEHSVAESPEGSTEELCISVNSLHHQAVKALAPGLVAMAWSPDGLVESYYRPASRFLWAVQWHPEMMTGTDPDSRRLFEAFVQAVGASV